MTTFCPSNDSFSADVMSRLVKHRLHSGPRPLASIPAAAEKEKKITVMRSTALRMFSLFIIFCDKHNPNSVKPLAFLFLIKKVIVFVAVNVMDCCISTLVGDIILCNPTTSQFSISASASKGKPSSSR